jgi:hypothetical protein
MIYRALIISILLTGAFALPATAESSSVQGDVLGTDGQPLKGAEIRIERKDKPAAPSTTVTNGKGYYSSAALAAGLYRISVVVGGTVKSAVTVRTVGDNARIDFNMSQSAGTSMKHYVWVPGGVGSHLGGRWVQADPNGAPLASALNVKVDNGQLVRQMERNPYNLNGR